MQPHLSQSPDGKSAGTILKNTPGILCVNKKKVFAKSEKKEMYTKEKKKKEE